MQLKPVVSALAMTGSDFMWRSRLFAGTVCTFFRPFSMSRLSPYYTRTFPYPILSPSFYLSNLSSLAFTFYPFTFCLLPPSIPVFFTNIAYLPIFHSPSHLLFPCSVLRLPSILQSSSTPPFRCSSAPIPFHRPSLPPLPLLSSHLPLLLHVLGGRGEGGSSCVCGPVSGLGRPRLSLC